MEKTAQTTTIAIKTQSLIFVLLAVVSFAVPFFLSTQQLITGTLVNLALFLAAKTLEPKQAWPMIFFPSLAVLSRGLIFGPMTKFLIIFLPFIWLGNLVLVSVFRKTQPRLGYWWGISLAALGKFVLLFLLAHLFFQLNLVPRLFLQTMGVNQLITASLGGLVSILILKRIGHE